MRETHRDERTRVTGPRSIREFAVAEDPWPIVDAWAQRFGYRLIESDGGRRVYRKGHGRIGASRKILVATTRGRLVLEAWIASPSLTRWADDSVPDEISVEPGGFVMVLPRRKGRAEANELLRALGAPPITDVALAREPEQWLFERIDRATELSQRGDFERSRARWEEILPEIEELFGPLHPITLTARQDHATVLLEVGQAERGLATLEQVLPDLQLVLGRDATATLNAAESIAVGLAIVGRESDARALGKRAVEDFERVFGAEHPRTLGALNKFEQRDWKTGKLAGRLRV
jgi:hypothetical protein